MVFLFICMNIYIQDTRGKRKGFETNRKREGEVFGLDLEKCKGTTKCNENDSTLICRPFPLCDIINQPIFQNLCVNIYIPKLQIIFYFNKGQ